MFSAGIMTVYLIILGDITVGSAPLYGGLLSTWFHLDAGSTWYLSRPFVVRFLLGEHRRAGLVSVKHCRAVFYVWPKLLRNAQVPCHSLLADVI